MLSFTSKWLDDTTEHVLNSESAIRACFKRIKIEKGSQEWARTVIGLVNDKAAEVKVYKGVHQDKFFSRNTMDSSRVDQTHFNIIVQGRPCHVYVQPNLGGQYEITEISNPPPVVEVAPQPEVLHQNPLIDSVLRMSGAFD